MVFLRRNSILNTLDTSFSEMFSYSALMEAHKQASRQKHYRGDVLKFSKMLENNISELQTSLLSHTYKMSGYHPFEIYEPKARVVMSLKYPDRVVQWAIYQVLYPFFDKLFIEDSYACRNGKGTHSAVERLSYWLKYLDRRKDPTKELYYLKLDISKYFYRVDHDILFNILKRRITDEDVLNLLYDVINDKSMPFGIPEGEKPSKCPIERWVYDKGIPIGNLTSQLFANIYLNELDQYCKHQLKIIYYIRYMDDILILSYDKDQLRQWYILIETFLNEELKLSLNQKSTLNKCSQGITFIGYRIWSTHILVKHQTARRFIRKFKKICRKLKSGEIPEEHFKLVWASYYGLLIKANTYHLRRAMDKYYFSVMLE